MFPLKSVILAFVTIVGSISLLNAASITSAVEPTQTRREGYTYIPGVGAYRVYRWWVTNWDGGRRGCERQDGYLAIINSVAEADAIVQLLNSSSHRGKVLVGLRDPSHEKKFVTLYGESIESTGFNRWQDGEPNGVVNDKDCVVLNSDGKYEDVQCTERFIAVCELHDDSSKLKTVLPQFTQFDPVPHTPATGLDEVITEATEPLPMTSTPSPTVD